MARPSKYFKELRERAVGLVMESRADYPSEFEAITSVAVKLGIGSAAPDRAGPAVDAMSAAYWRPVGLERRDANHIGKSRG